MRHILLTGLLMLAALFASTPSHADETIMPTAALQERYDALIHELRCMTCQNQSIADSPVGLASDLRRDVREQLNAGKTDDEIRAWMVNRYGTFILFRPPFKGSTAWVWLAPFVLLLLGAFIAWRIVRQRTALVASDDSIIETEDAKS
jgi:cytochrome c-type biogenesis protein CcmH